MPRGDGTGTHFEGAAESDRGSGRGRMSGSKAGAGPGGQCVCPSCGATVTHQAGLPCYQIECPECNASMVRS